MFEDFSEDMPFVGLDVGFCPDVENRFHDDKNFVYEGGILSALAGVTEKPLTEKREEESVAVLAVFGKGFRVRVFGLRCRSE